ncbi:MAG: DUF1501 domain-containing protein [Cyanobacteria bacterium J083]|nr:MAG: DUF1501 domain-containing protein [Cyanobacteria bacterium J083]
MHRRKFLALGAGILLPLGLKVWVARSQSVPRDTPKLIVVFLRGAIDGLSVAVPYQAEEYYSLRPTIALSQPQTAGGVIDLDGYFGLNPHLEALMPMWQAGNLAFVHNCGFPAQKRSHFEAQDDLEMGVTGEERTQDGWLNRLLALLSLGNPTQGISVGKNIPLIFQGTQAVANLPTTRRINNLPIDRPLIDEAFSLLYSGDDPASKAYQSGLQARKIILAQLQQEMNSSARGAYYSIGLAEDARRLASLMKGDSQTQLGFMEIGGWDTHINQKPRLNKLLTSLGKGLSTLVTELGSVYNQTIIIVMSEFGRTVAENGNNGTDHGKGNLMWILGGKVKGGKMYGNWSGLESSQLAEGRELPVTTDFRTVITPILQQHLRIPPEKLTTIFPDFSPPQELNLFA